MTPAQLDKDPHQHIFVSRCFRIQKMDCEVYRTLANAPSSPEVLLGGYRGASGCHDRLLPLVLGDTKDTNEGCAEIIIKLHHLKQSIKECSPL